MLCVFRVLFEFPSFHSVVSIVLQPPFLSFQLVLAPVLAFCNSQIPQTAILFYVGMLSARPVFRFFAFANL